MENKKKNVKVTPKTAFKIGIISGLSLLLILALGMLISTMGKSNSNEIPELVNKHEMEIDKIVNDKDIIIQKTKEYSDTVEKGYIIRQLTEKDSDGNTVLTIVISDGKDPNGSSSGNGSNSNSDSESKDATVKAPDFTKMTKKEIEEFGKKHGVVIQYLYQTSENETGTILSQKPKKGEELKNNDKVIITISEGQLNEMPNLVGKSKSSAISTLKNMKLKVNVIDTYSNHTASGNIVGQSIGSGRPVNHGDTVTLKVSIGKPYIRNYKHMSYEELEKYISDINKQGGDIKLHKISEKSNDINKGDIIDMKGDDYFPCGSTLEVWVSDGEDLSYKSFVGKTVTEFKNWLGTKNLEVKYIEKYSSTVAKGEIISSSPTNLSNTRNITIEYSVGEYNIPNIERWKIEEVEDELVRARDAGARITTEYSYEYSDQHSKGRIIRYHQNGDHIDIVISDGRKPEPTPEIKPDVKPETKPEVTPQPEQGQTEQPNQGESGDIIIVG